MKTTLTIIAILLTLSGFTQIANVPIMQDTTVNGSKFIYTYKGDIYISCADSVGSDNNIVPGYISLIHSRAVVNVLRKRVVNGDTITKVEGMEFPLSAIATKYNTFINTNEFKRAVKKAIKNNSVTRRLNQE